MDPMTEADFPALFAGVAFRWICHDQEMRADLLRRAFDPAEPIASTSTNAPGASPRDKLAGLAWRALQEKASKLGLGLLIDGQLEPGSVELLFLALGQMAMFGVDWPFDRVPGTTTPRCPVQER